MPHLCRIKQQGMWLLLVSSHQVGQRQEQTRSRLVVWSAPAALPAALPQPSQHVSTVDPPSTHDDQMPMGWRCRANGERMQIESGGLTKHILKYLPNTCHSNSGKIGGTSVFAFWLYQYFDHKIPTELVSPKIYRFGIDTIYFYICCADSGPWKTAVIFAADVQFSSIIEAITLAPLESKIKCHLNMQRTHFVSKPLDFWTIFPCFSSFFEECFHPKILSSSPQRVLGRCWERPWSRTHGWHLRKLLCHEDIYIYIYVIYI